jgi:hypothetical protein
MEAETVKRKTSHDFARFPRYNIEGQAGGGSFHLSSRWCETDQ